MNTKKCIISSSRNRGYNIVTKIPKHPFPVRYKTSTVPTPVITFILRDNQNRIVFTNNLAFYKRFVNNNRRPVVSTFCVVSLFLGVVRMGFRLGRSERSFSFTNYVYIYLHFCVQLFDRKIWLTRYTRIPTHILLVIYAISRYLQAVKNVRNITFFSVSN